MRILFECYSCGPRYGSETYNGWNWPLTMAKRGHEVSVLTIPNAAIEPELQQLGLKIAFHYVEPPPIPRQIPRAYGFRYLLWLRKSLTVAKSLGSFDVVHHASWGHMFSATHLWQLGFPTVMGPCGGAQTLPPQLLQWLHADQTAERMRTISVKLNESSPSVRKRISHCNMLTVNKESYRAALRLGAKSVTMFGDSAVEPDMIASSPAQGENSEEPRIVWLGRMLPRKGAELALEAFDRLPSKASLLMIGGGPRLEAAKSYASKLSSKDRIRFTGKVPHGEVIPLLRSSDVFLFTSLRDSGGAQFYEAMACGLPVVTLDMHGGAVIVPDSAGIKVPVSAGSTLPDAIAATLNDICQDRSLRLRLAEGALKEIRSQTWSDRAIKAEEIYRSILASG